MKEALLSRATISGETALCVIIAAPVAHLRTPQALNAHFLALGCDGVMVPLEVAAADLAVVMAALRRLKNLRGIVVTVPHKQAVVAFCDELTAAAREVGAVNVIRREADGRLVGGQYDGEGFLAGLRRAGYSVAGRSAYLAGAGGAAAAIAFALARHGVVRLGIYNRTRTKAEDLAARVAAAYPTCRTALAGSDPSGYDMVINATSLGMREDDPLPFDASRLAPSQLVAEVIMSPEVTPLLAAAKKRGCPVHPGRPMLEAQIALLAEFMLPSLRSAPAGEGA